MISKEEFFRLCDLAKIEIAEEEYPKVCESLEKIIDFASVVTNIEVDANIKEDEPVFFEEMMRDDVALPSLAPEDFLKNAPARRDDFFLIRRGK